MTSDRQDEYHVLNEGWKLICEITNDLARDQRRRVVEFPNARPAGEPMGFIMSWAATAEQLAIGLQELFNQISYDALTPENAIVQARTQVLEAIHGLRPQSRLFRRIGPAAKLDPMIEIGQYLTLADRLTIELLALTNQVPNSPAIYPFPDTDVVEVPATSERSEDRYLVNEAWKAICEITDELARDRRLVERPHPRPSGEPMGFIRGWDAIATQLFISLQEIFSQIARRQTTPDEGVIEARGHVLEAIHGLRPQSRLFRRIFPPAQLDPRTEIGQYMALAQRLSFSLRDMMNRYAAEAPRPAVSGVIIRELPSGQATPSE